MEIEPTDPKTMLSSAVAILLGVLTWVWLRLVGQQDRHEKRLIELERAMATKGDITAVYEQIDGLKNQSHAQYVDLSNRMGDQHTQILNTLLRSGK